MKIVTRFAPSPTGSLHLGSARTAIFNWLFSRSRGGDFVLRIEDTDRARSEKRFEDEIVESLGWLGLSWRDGVARQSERLGIYRRLAQRLVDEGKAYRCYVTAAELESRRAEAREKKQVFRYRREWSRVGEAPGKPYSVRLSVPDGRTVRVDDLVRGRISFGSAEIEDFVILKADGFPTYNFAAAVDDAQMEISHVIRGDDHIINAPRQILVADALGFSKPMLAHVPMILGEDGKKLSKRHGAESLAEYRFRGYLPEAALNYLVRLGWSFGDQEIFTREELVEKFDLRGLGKSPSVFDPGKFLWLNGRYVRDMPVGEISGRVAPFMEREGLSPEPGGRLERIVDLLRERSETLWDVALQAGYFFSDDFEYEAAAAGKFLVRRNEGILENLCEELAAVKDFSRDNVRKGFDRVMRRTGLGLGKIAQPARVALTGGAKSPGIFDVVEMLGRETVERRLRRAVAFIRSRRSQEMKIYGLTGNIGSGKSTVARMLRDLGAFTVDADEAAREVVRPGEPALGEIVACFGPEVLLADGSLDRAKLADIAFSDDAKRKKLNAITHPRILERIRERISGDADARGIVFVEAALIVEKNGALRDMIEGLVVVTCPKELRARRVEGRDGMTPERVRRLMDSQMSEKEKSARADFLIENDSDMETLRARVLGLWEELCGNEP